MRDEGFCSEKKYCKEFAQRIIATDGIYGRRRGHASNNLYYKGSPYSYVQKIEQLVTRNLTNYDSQSDLQP